MTTRYLLAVGALALAAAVAQPQEARAAAAGAVRNGPTQSRAGMDLNRASVPDGFTFAAGGDIFKRTPITQLGHPEIDKMLKLLQSADVAYGNHESSAFDLPGPGTVTHGAQNGGGYPRFSYALEQDFKAMGIDIVSMANNHAGDWGVEGLMATLTTIANAGLVQAGGGASLSEARRPGVFYSPRGNVALISTASTFNPASVAEDGNGAIKPRPGISYFRARPVIELTEQQMDLMTRVGQAWWNPNSGVRPDIPGGVTVGGATYRVGSSGKITYHVEEADRKALTDSITAAKRQHDLVALSMHAHEVDTTGSRASVGDFLPTLFHQAIDAGADVVMRTGPHILGGVEIYKGKPIFYGLSNLFFEFGSYEQAKDPEYRARSGFFDNVLGITEFKDGKPSVVKLYPLETIVEDSPAMGASKIATGEAARRIINTIQEESRPWGTQIAFENDIGIIRIAQ
ncbi:MAG: CapA family protein [Nevskiaceae bacterium]|jgi:poly-gamma-glutamate synthesis protein (capsule biosynthesis protein)|nr:CapA family protein [Nevskiaceae bacterium]